MDKNIIKNHLTARFLNEESTPGIDVTKKALKQSEKINKAGVKDMDKELAGYDKAIKKTDKVTKMPTNKFNYNGDKEKEYHDQMEIMNGQEMIQYDRQPNQEYKDRAEEAIAGSSRMGNNPEWANTGESDVNKKRNKIRKDNMLAKLKRKAYNKSPQPVVNDTAGEDKGSAIMAKLESTEPKQAKQINEEFDRMKSLIGYNQKTQ